MALAVHRQSSEVRYVPVTWADGQLSATFDGQRFAVPHEPDDDVAAALATLASQLSRAGLDFEACVNCRWFHATGASLQQSGGWAGYCAIVALRNARGLVSADYGCLQWSLGAGWPDDPQRLQAERQRALRSGRPDRRSNYVGCFVGLFRAGCIVKSQVGAGDNRTTSAEHFLEVVRGAAQAIVSDTPPWAKASDQQIADRLGEHLAAVESHWALLAAAIPLGAAAWRSADRATNIIRRLADQLHAVDAVVLPAVLASRLFGLAMCKRPYDMSIEEIGRWVEREGKPLMSVWQPWLEAARAGTTGSEALWEFAEQDSAQVVASAWLVWQQAGGLFDPICQHLSRRSGAATAIAGGLSGTVHGERAVAPRTNAERATCQTWIELGEQLFERTEEGAAGT